MSARLRNLSTAWLFLSALFAASGLMRQLPVFAVPAMIWGLTFIALFVLRQRPDLRADLAIADLSPVFAFHALRAPIGVAFFFMGQRGLLDPLFVQVAGTGDIIAGIGAVIVGVLWSVRPGDLKVRWAVLVWNILALADILLVFVTAQRVLFFGAGIDAMQGFFLFPMPMIPSFVVPMVLLTHLLVFVRVGPLVRQREA